MTEQITEAEVNVLPSETGGIFGGVFMIRLYQSVYSHKYDLAHVVVYTFNSVFITPQAVIRDGFFIRFLT